MAQLLDKLGKAGLGGAGEIGQLSIPLPAAGKTGGLGTRRVRQSLSSGRVWADVTIPPSAAKVGSVYARIVFGKSRTLQISGTAGKGRRVAHLWSAAIYRRFGRSRSEISFPARNLIDSYH
ncbi:MAG TPA: hypothetical protein VFI31_05535 [Pirellulales bacterium]|nr:hypothetical protein [Pirellulales bacterium]